MGRLLLLLGSLIMTIIGCSPVASPIIPTTNVSATAISRAKESPTTISPDTTPIPTAITTPSTPTEPPPTNLPRASVTSTQSFTTATPQRTTNRIQAAAGYVEGQASIGPLIPVEQVGVPTPTPSPAVCTSRSLIVYQADGQTEVTRVLLQPDCRFRIALSPGTYVIGMPKTVIGGSKDLPKTVAVEDGKTVRLDISIDTGIR